MFFQTWLEATFVALQGAWDGIIGFLPNLLGALVVFLVGWVIAEGVGQLVVRLLKLLRFDQLLEKGGWKEAFAKAGGTLDVSGFIGSILKWILVIVFLLAAADILGFVQFSVFLGALLGYLGNVILAVLIFVVAVIIADILEKLVVASAEKAKLSHIKFLGSLTRWSVLIFAFLAILLQLGVAPSLINTIVMGLVGMVALAGGVAFGLGGKDLAADLLKELKDRIS